MNGSQARGAGAVNGSQARGAGAVNGSQPPGRLRLVTSNMLLSNRRLPAYCARLRALAPDLLLVQEVTPDNLRSLEELGLAEGLPHRVEDAREGLYGSLVLSRIPLHRARVVRVGAHPMTRADLVTGAGPVTVLNVHAVAPLSRARVGPWRRQLEELALVRAPAGGHLVLAGDFNATVHHRPFARLLRRGLRDAFAEAGRGRSGTWPVVCAGLPAPLRVDHVLVGEGVSVSRAATFHAPGSDHRLLVADLALGPIG